MKKLGKLKLNEMQDFATIEQNEQMAIKGGGIGVGPILTIIQIAIQLYFSNQGSDGSSSDTTANSGTIKVKQNGNEGSSSNTQNITINNTAGNQYVISSGTETVLVDSSKVNIINPDSVQFHTDGSFTTFGGEYTITRY